jgi:exodeoxyribonuclease VII large subunit
MKPGLLQRPIALKGQRLTELSTRLAPIVSRRLQREGERLASLERQRVSLNPEGPLERGYTLIRRANGRLATSARELAPAEAVRLRFKDGERNAIIDGAPGRKLSRGGPGNPDQGDLF